MLNVGLNPAQHSAFNIFFKQQRSCTFEPILTLTNYNQTDTGNKPASKKILNPAFKI